VKANAKQTDTGKRTKTPATNRAVARDSKPNISNYPDRWVKAPVKGYCPHSGLTRPALYDLSAAGKIKTACIRKPGAIRGNRLFHLGSILAFLDVEANATAAREARP